MGESNGMKVMYMVWGWLLLLTIVEVVLAYFQVTPTLMLIILIGLSLIKAVLIMAWFMHLKFERLSLVLTLIPAMVSVILLMNVLWPDSNRVRSEGVFRELPPPTPESQGEAGH